VSEFASFKTNKFFLAVCKDETKFCDWRGILINFGLDLVHGQEVEGSIWSLSLEYVSVSQGKKCCMIVK